MEAPGAFLFEPVKAVVRAHLFGVLAARHGLWQIDPRIAYLSGNQPVHSPLLKTYRVLRELPFDLKAIKDFLGKEEVGRLEVKKRGVGLVPEEFRAGLKLAGANEGTLIFTRAMRAENRVLGPRRLRALIASRVCRSSASELSPPPGR